jgi:hypothetical protein
MCELNKKFKEWKKWYSEDNLSICAQIREMIWDAAVYYTINEARMYATTGPDGEPELNKLVHRLINKTFLQTQSLSIRKLYSRNNVFSLGRLINDMEKNSKLLTRENVLSALELPYDYEKAIDEGHRTDNSNMTMKGAFSENVHENIDLLAGVGPTQRQPNDTVQDRVFNQLNKWLDKCSPIDTFVDKIVAHTTPSNKDLRISLARIHMAHCRILGIATFIGQVLLYDSSGWSNFLRDYAGDKFEHFEKPWISKENVTKLENFWGKYKKRIERLTVIKATTFI